MFWCAGSVLAGKGCYRKKGILFFVGVQQTLAVVAFELHHKPSLGENHLSFFLSSHQPSPLRERSDTRILLNQRVACCYLYASTESLSNLVEGFFPVQDSILGETLTHQESDQ